MPEVVVVAVMRAKAGSEEEVADSLAQAAARTPRGAWLPPLRASPRHGRHGADRPRRALDLREALNEHFTKPYIQELGQRAHLLAEPAQVHFLDALPVGDPAKGSL